MTIFKNSKFKIEAANIPQCHTKFKTQYFVDTLCGKNEMVFDNKDKAINWAMENLG